MKNVIFGLVLILFASINAAAQSSEYMRIFKDGNYTELNRHMSDQVQLEIGRSKENLDKSSAIAKLRERLNRFGAVEWEMIHRGESEHRDANYYIVKAGNSKGEGLRIFIHTSVEGTKRKITAIRFRRAL